MSNYSTIIKKKGKNLDITRYEKEREFIHENRNELGFCPYCDSNIKDRKVALYKELINSLYRIYCWCGRERKHEFEVKEIRQFLGKVEYTRFNNLVRFGGILYKPKINGESKRALFGINMKRAKDFFNGKSDIPVQIVLDQITNEIIGEIRCKVDEFPELHLLLTTNGVYDYEVPIQEIMDFKLSTV